MLSLLGNLWCGTAWTIGRLPVSVNKHTGVYISVSQRLPNGRAIIFSSGGKYFRFWKHLRFCYWWYVGIPMKPAAASDIFGVVTCTRSSLGCSWLLSSHTWHMSLKTRPQVLTPAKLPWLWLGFICTQEFETTDQEVNMDPSINFLGLWRNKSGVIWLSGRHIYIKLLCWDGIGYRLYRMKNEECFETFATQSYWDRHCPSPVTWD